MEFLPMLVCNQDGRNQPDCDRHYRHHADYPTTLPGQGSGNKHADNPQGGERGQRVNPGLVPVPNQFASVKQDAARDAAYDQNNRYVIHPVSYYVYLQCSTWSWALLGLFNEQQEQPYRHQNNQHDTGHTDNRPVCAHNGWNQRIAGD